MRHETSGSETLENRENKSKNYLDIKPQTGITTEKCKSFLKSLFCETGAETKGEKPELSENKKEYYDDNGNCFRIGNELIPNSKFERNSYRYETDNKGRIIKAEGTLHEKTHNGKLPINESREAIAHGEMVHTDDKGHLIADRFGGSNKLENLAAMDRKLNQGDYARLEGKLAGALDDGKHVTMSVEPVYRGADNRPTKFRVSYSIDGEKDVAVFKNGSGKNDG